MKKLYTLIAAVAALTLTGCQSDALEGLEQEGMTQMAKVSETDTDLFAVKTDETDLPSTAYDINSATYWNDPNCATAAAKLVALVDPQRASGLGSLNITSAQVEKIKTYTNNNITKDVETEYDKVMAILKWVNSNIKYDWVDNDPYAVFTNRKGVCQGYAGLMVVMLHTQGIPAVMANGYMANVGGHAWVYTYADSTWYVSDPTNTPSKVWKMDDVSTYKNTLQPWTLDMVLAEDDDFTYDWRDKLWQVREVKCQDKEVVSIPYGAMGYKLTGFDPVGGINKNVRELYLSYNIVSVGAYVDGLSNHGDNLEYIHVWNEQNHKINDYDGCLYTVSYSSVKKTTTYKELKYVPGQKTSIRVAPMKEADKNVITKCMNLEEIYFDETTVTYRAWCVEDCPKVKRIYIPIGSTVEENAFYGCDPNLEIIEYDPLETGIKDIRI